MSITNPDDLIDYLYEEIHRFLVEEAGEELGHDEIDISLTTAKNGEIHIEINIFLELAAYSNIDVEDLIKRAIDHGGELADKVCPALVKSHVSTSKS